MKRTEPWEKMIPLIPRLIAGDSFSVEELRCIQHKLYIIQRQVDWFLKNVNQSLDCVSLP